MKKIILMMAVAGMLFSCNEKWEVYNSSENRLGFDYDANSSGIVEDSIKRFTFVYEPQDIIIDTIWLKVNTLGFLSDKDRAFELEQVEVLPSDLGDDYVEGMTIYNLEPGLHYVPFDDPSMEKYLVVKAGENTATFPFVVKRDDPKLKESKFWIKIKVKDNENFIQSYSTDQFRIIEISDIITKPAAWNGYPDYYFAGEYGPEKLRFMIDNSDWRVDDDWFNDNFGDPYNIDMGYTGYLSSYYTDKLIKYNRERKAQGLDVLKESNGKIVRFTLYGEELNYE